MGDTVVQDRVGEGDPRVVYPGRTIGEHSEGQVGALKRLDSNVAKRRREDDIVRDNVVSQDLLESLKVRSLEHGTNRLESLVRGDEDGEVGDVETLGLGPSQTEGEVEVSSFKRSVDGEIAGSGGEELERGAE